MASEREQVNGFRAGGRRRRASGYTLIEMMVIVAIIAIMAALAFSNYWTARPRMRLRTTAAEIQTAIMFARQEAIGGARDVAVLFYPGTEADLARVVVYQDAAGGFMNGTGAPNFCTFDPKTMAGTSTTGDVGALKVIEFHWEIRFGPPTSLVQIAFPFNLVPTSVTGCSFCDADFAKGAIRFDSRGRATFYSTCGSPLGAPARNGGSITLVVRRLEGASVGSIMGTFVVVVTPTGNVRVFNAG